MALRGRAIDNWHAILQEKEKQNRLAPLLAVVNEEYGANPPLRAVMLQLAGWPAPVATLVVAGQQPFTPRRAGLVVILVVLVSMVVWGTQLWTGQREQPEATPSATLTIAPPTATPTPASFTYFVTVLDAEGQPIARAQVMVEIEGKAPLEDEADSAGYARIAVPAGYVERPGRLRVRADGFAAFDQNVELYPERLPNTVRLARQ